jgi:hypothetical protein
MPKHEMQVGEACDLMKRKITEFEVFWNRKCRENPVDYSRALPTHADWIEQFVVWAKWDSVSEF